MNDYGLKQDDVIINCIGIINKLVENEGVISTIKVNSIFPNLLERLCDIRQFRFIHISTDCVYKGDKGHYSESDLHDATDIYGKTKSLGEPMDCTVIRTSIIGEEKSNYKRSLLEWVKSNAGKTIDGYINHKWNGVTCLRLAQGIAGIIEEKKYWKGVKHVFGNTVNKYELCCMINDIYKLNIQIKMKDTDLCDRTLRSIRGDIPMYQPDLYTDIVAQKEFGI